MLVVQALVSVFLFGCGEKRTVMPRCNNEPIKAFNDFKGCLNKKCFKDMEVIASAPGNPHDRFQHLVRAALNKGDQIAVVWVQEWDEHGEDDKFWKQWQENVNQSYQNAEGCKYHDQKLLVLTKQQEGEACPDASIPGADDNLGKVQKEEMKKLEKWGYAIKCQTIDSYLDSTPSLSTNRQKALNNLALLDVLSQSENTATTAVASNLTNRSSPCCEGMSSMLSAERAPCVKRFRKAGRRTRDGCHCGCCC